VRGEGHEPERRGGTVGASGHATAKPSNHPGLCLIKQAPMPRRNDNFPRERSAGCPGTGLRRESACLTALQKSADGIVGTRARAAGLHGREAWRPGVEPRDGIRRGVGGCSASGRNARLAHGEKTRRLGCRLPGLHLPNRRLRDPYVRWCGRGEAVRSLPIPIGPTSPP
jgi:hypothetical protein